MKAFLMAVALGFAAVGECRAQGASRWPETQSCQGTADSTTSYARCSLWLEDDRLFLGRPGEQVSHAETLRPVALSRYVAGDSARRYALRYERDMRSSLWLRLAGSAVVLTASVTGMRSRCAGGFWNGDRVTANDRILFSGLAVELASYALRLRAEWEGTQAIGWHNGGLSR
jgi:hypothetical protein